jgi:hypothetical protein
LRSRPQQERALLRGFRPADPSVPMRTNDAQNPFVRNAEFGVKTDVPPVAEPPDPSVVRNLVALWSRQRQRALARFERPWLCPWLWRKPAPARRLRVLRASSRGG